ncbi:B-box zinc finger protein 24-like isoform X2 [Sesamum indicum]|uniref:B-box zinc finger protein 24-like isoform X2 n=1 Tax=Sesamum indicum TaxID=4182 RepID=A0A6I9SWM8_SESIN|nr:B-box zinc finger protein 24-like isoform X2 [Sesamum indicum]
MKIQCDMCEKAQATVICCADEAALCEKCDVEVHAANKLASKHQRLLLECLSNKLPRCDICRDKAAFIFCVEDRALFCKDCDQPIHSANSFAAKHQRYLATGIRVALTSTCNKESSKSQMEPRSASNSQQTGREDPIQHASGITSPSWGADELLQFSDYESSDKESLAAAEVPQLPLSQSSNITSYRPTKFCTAHKKPRIDVPDVDEEHFTVPDLG